MYKNMLGSINKLDFYLVYESQSYELEENLENTYWEILTKYFVYQFLITLKI